MSTCQTRVRRRLPARPESIAPLRRAVVELTEASGASDLQREDIALAVSEAVSNAVLHAYAGHGQPGDVAVEAWTAERSLEVLVCDEGIGLLARAWRPGLWRRLALIARLTKALRIETADPPPGLRLRMTFAIG